MEFKEYRDEINHIFSHYTKRGFVDYRACRGLWSDMTSLLTEATAELSRKGQYKELFDLANKAFLKWAKTNKDDSDGETQDFAMYVFDAWNAVYDAEYESVNHKKMLDWFMKNLDGTVIDYMEDFLYEYMMNHFKEEYLLYEKLQFMKNKVDEIIATGDEFAIRYSAQRCQEYALMLMGELKLPIDEVRIYANDIKSFYHRDALAQIELAYGNIAEAIAEYEKLADWEDQRWGYNEYRVSLMNLYKEIGNQEKYFENLKKALEKAIGNEELFVEYKQNFMEEDWPKACEDLFGSLRKGDYRANTWYEIEGRFDLIMDNIEASNDTETLKYYEKKLKKLFADRCLKVLVDCAEKTAIEGSKRSDYRRLAGLLNWIQKYPKGDGIAEKLAQKYRDTYPRRKAMLEEISRF